MRRLAWIEIARAPEGDAGGADSNSADHSGGNGGSGGGGGAEGGGGGADNAAPAAFDWAGSLGERHGEFADTLKAKGWKGPADVLAAYGQLEKDSAGRVAIPGEGASDDDRAAFWKALGRPDSPDGYGLARPENMPEAEWDNERMGRFAAAAHALGMPAAHVKGVIDWLAKDTAEQIAAFEADLPKQQQAHETALQDGLRKEYGAKAPEVIERAKRAFQIYAGDEAAAAAIDVLSAKAGDLNIIKMFAAIAEDIGEARLRGAGGGGGAVSPEQARAELNKLKSDPEFRQAFTNSSHPRHKEFVERHDALVDASRSSKP
jgi:hypothetical protein